jgi:hypothetical protein
MACLSTNLSVFTDPNGLFVDEFVCVLCSMFRVFNCSSGLFWIQNMSAFKFVRITNLLGLLNLLAASGFFYGIWFLVPRNNV